MECAVRISMLIASIQSFAAIGNNGSGKNVPVFRTVSKKQFGTVCIKDAVPSAIFVPIGPSCRLL